MATVEDLEELVDVQQEAAVPAFGHIFSQDEHPFPRGTIAARWLSEIDDPAYDVLVSVDDDDAITGFSASRADELVHFGTALSTWGTGVAQTLLDAALERMRDGGVTLARLWVLDENHRGRRFYEKLGWVESEGRSHSPFAPFPAMRELTKRLG